MAIICPPTSPIPSLVAQNCPIDFDQVQAVAFQEAGTPFTDLTDIQTLASWTTLLAAVNATKVQVAQVYNAILNSSEALTNGGNDNTTLDGIPEYNGEGFTSITWEFRSISFENKRSLKAYVPHSIRSIGDTNLVCYFFARGNKIIYNTNDGAGGGTEFAGFPVYNFRISSVGSQGLNGKNIFQSGVSVGEGWDDWAATTQAAFNIADVLP